MPYSAEINRNQPTCFLFVIDQSGSMNERMPSGRTKAEFVADVLNKTLTNLIVRCTKAEGVRNYFDVGVVAYGGNGVGPGFAGPLSGQFLQPIGAVDASPLRIETRTKKEDDNAGGLVERSVRFQVWFEPRAAGGTPMCEALRRTAEILVEWCARHPSSYPPTVIHVTDGESTDGDPQDIAGQLQQIMTNDGASLLFNLHIDVGEGPGLMFPATEQTLPDEHSRRLFRMSSYMPPELSTAAREKGYNVSNETRFFGYRAGIEGIVDFFDIGTRASGLR